MNLYQRLVSRAMLLTVCAALFGCSEPNSDNSTASWVKPNVLLIVADDLGYSDLGIYGSEIPTPNIDALARSGALLTNFYANATCAPSRSMLLSGMDSHQVGFGINPSAANRLPVLRGQPGYSGNWPDNINSFVNQFSDSNYYTFMTGKWHQGSAAEATPQARGFQKAFYLQEGGASHFADAAGQTSAAAVASYFDNGEPVAALPDDFYSSEFYVNKVINYLDDRESEDARPFFGYLAFTAPHWPLQVPMGWLDRFSGAYDEGWEIIRERRTESAKRLGLIPQDFTAAPLPSALGSWNDLSSAERRAEARRMELYAAMIAFMDDQIGRLVAHLKATGQYDNTLIVFLSDNGPEGNNIEFGLADNQSWLPERFDQSYDNMGRVNSYVTFSRGWAHVSAGPLSQYKSFLGEGGVRVPAIFSYPARIESNRKMQSLMSIMDIAPTLMAFSEVASSPNFEMQGQSATAQLTAVDNTNAIRPHLAMETYGNKAVWSDNFKLLWNWQSGDWQLFDIQQDPGETNDLSVTSSALRDTLVDTFNDYAQTNGVVILEEEVGYARYPDQVEAFSGISP